MQVQYRLWDVYGETQMQGTQFNTPPSNWRSIAHRIADEVYQRLTGETGYFNTQIVYIAAQGPQNRRIQRQAIMDQDGANNRFTTPGQAHGLHTPLPPPPRAIHP